jgi:hypothetical protein
MPIELSFERGQLVVVALRNPKERYWGKLAGLESAGIAIRGFDLSQWEQVLSTVKSGEMGQAPLDTKFFPMHRVEAMYIDEAESGVESLCAEFQRRAGMDPLAFLKEK